MKTKRRKSGRDLNECIWFSFVHFFTNVKIIVKNIFSHRENIPLNSEVCITNIIVIINNDSNYNLI